MKNIERLFTFMAAAMLLGYSCSSAPQEEKGLKDALEGKFYMGVAMNTPQITGADTISLDVIRTHFNSIVAENVMKSGPIHPAEGEYAFEQPDQFVEFGEANDMYIVGHTLVWHSQAPRWFFTDENGEDVSRDVLIERMKSHISTVVGRYKGKVDAWDVVNEAFLDDGSWRETKFYQIIGEDFIKLAFQFAHEADPDAELMYNDYSMFMEGRRDAVVKLVKSLQADDIPIHGVGMQAHYGLDYPDMADLEKSILAFSETGVDVHITELDLSVLPSPWNRSGAEISDQAAYMESMNPYKDALPDSASQALNDRYAELFGLFLKHEDKIKRVTTWGLADQHSWKNGWPIPGRTDYPLLFNRDFQPKPVVEEIMKMAAETEE